MNAVRLAVTWLTVLPIRGPSDVDRKLAGRAIALAPLVGLLLGGFATAVLWGVRDTGAPDLVAGLITVAALALATRAMHLDGLSDTFDGLGSYGPPERVREVMKSGAAGPFGVTALVLCLAIQAAAFAELDYLGVLCAVTAGRIAVVAACCAGISPIPSDGLGALVISTQRPWYAGLWITVLAVAAMLLNPLALLGILLAGMAIAGLVWHCTRRFGALNGDVLGAVSEIGVTIVAVSMTFAVIG